MIAGREPEGAARTSGASLPPTAVTEVCKRLSEAPELLLPNHVVRSLKETPTALSKFQYLSELLHRDPSIFLERHGRLLRDAELAMFRPLAAADYEVAFYLKHINQQRDPPASLVKNRYALGWLAMGGWSCHFCIYLYFS